MLRVAVLEGEKDVAYETCLLSSLRPGFRVLHLRSLLGTRIEARGRFQPSPCPTPAPALIPSASPVPPNS